MKLNFFRPFAAVLMLVLLAVTRASASPHVNTTGTLSSPLDTRSPLQARQAVGANFCANVNLRVRNILNTGTVLLGDSVCICLSGGALTPTSLATIDTSISNTAGGTLLGPILRALGLDVVTASVRALALQSLNTLLQANLNDPTATRCNYPSSQTGFAYPACPADSCAFTCQTGYKVCGNNCILNSRACVSNIPQRRSLDARRCPVGLSACPVPGNKGAFECVDTSASLDSCGGCAFPFPGMPAGEDCSAIEGAGDVQCVRGVCQVKSCARGFVLLGMQCVMTLRAQ